VTKKNLAVFCDRDGVINREVDNLHDVADLEILPKVAPAIKLLNNKGIPLIVVTNQPVVARGWLTENGVEKIHQEIKKRLKKDDAVVDEIYYCPHHPDANLKKYRVKCQCRKPNVQLFEKAAQDFGINLKKSFVIGDSFRDIEAGKNIQATTIFVKSGTGDLRDSKPDFVTGDLYSAIKLILEKEDK